MRRSVIDNSPKDGAARQAKYRQEQAKLGRRPRLVYLTDQEKADFDRWLAERRVAAP